MKRFVSILVLSMLFFDANAANNGRPVMSGKMVMPAAQQRYTASVNQLNGIGNVKVNTTATQEETVVETVVEPPVAEVKEEKDMREAERSACINNNIGIGNTFVWASRYSDTSNYANMVEDVENPMNNVCFVRVELKSDDESRVKVSDIAPKYFMWGETIECGSWADEKEMEKRILDARKGARIGGIVASTVGGAGLGVGAMELIGNTSIKGWKGQKELEGVDLYKSQILVLQNSKKAEDQAKYGEIVSNLKVIRDAKAAGAKIEKYEENYEPLIKEFVK